MQRIFTAIAALSLVVGLLSGLAAPASATVEGYDSSYFGESSFLNLTPGQSGQFAVGFNNTGATGWVRGTASQVDLQICLPDKVTCGTTSPNSAWAQNWFSPTVYSTATTDFVGPGQTGWFVYNVQAPASSAGTTARFNGDLALHATGQQIHPQGYYQDATVAAAVVAPPVTGGGGGGGGAATPSAVSTVTASNLREITVTFNTSMAQSGAGSIFDAWHYTLSGGLEIDGARTSSGSQVILTVGKSVNNNHDGTHLSNNAATYMTQGGTYTLTVTNVANSGFQLTGTATTTFTVQDSTSPTATAPTIIGADSFYMIFSEPMDPSATNSAMRWDSQTLCSGASSVPDCLVTGAGNSGIANIHWQDLSGNDCASASTSTGATGNGCFQVVRVDFAKTPRPASGNHTLDISNAKDAAGNFISPNPTTFTVNLPGSSDTTQPTVSSANVALNGNQFYIDVTFSEAMSHTLNGYTAPDGLDRPGNYILRNPDGSSATTGGSNGSGSAISFTVTPTTDNDLSTASPSRFQLKRARLILSPVGANTGQGATTTPTLRANTQYTIEIDNVKDEAGNVVAPGTIRTLSWAGDSSAPSALRAYVTSNQLSVDFSEMITSFVGSPSNCTNACDRTHYTSPNSTFNTWLGTMTSPSPGSNAGITPVGFDNASVNFTNASTLTSGTYELDISGVVDPFGNILSPNPAIITVTVGSTTRPTLVGAGAAATGVATTAQQFGVKFSAQMQGGLTGTNSAGNPANYSVDNGGFGSFCTSGSATITAGPVAGDGSQVWTVSCSGAGAWSPVGTHTVTVSNVEDLSNNMINPNPSTAAFTNP